LCDFCFVWFIDENAVSITYDENLNPIFKECGNCRKLALNTNFIIEFLNKKINQVLDEYLKLIVFINRDVAVIIIS